MDMYRDMERLAETFGIKEEAIPDFCQEMERIYIVWVIRFAEQMIRQVSPRVLRVNGLP